MTDQTPRRKGGRPCIPPPPQNAGDCRALIATEVVRTNPRVRTLQQLYRLLKAFVAAEVQAAAELKNRLLAEQNRIAQEGLELKQRDYLIRMSKSPLAFKVIQSQKEQIAELKEKVRTLEASALEVGVKSEDRGLCAA